MEQELVQHNCGNMAGHGNCAQAILKAIAGKQNGCPGIATKQCMCRHANNPAINVQRASLFLETPAVALRYLGHRAWSRAQEEALQRIDVCIA
jgi:hypothetical protein